MDNNKNVLTKICEDKLRHIERQKTLVTQRELEDKAQEAGTCRGFLRALQEKVARGHNALIAEVKKASPSKGVIRQNFDPVEIAIAYEKSGAACLSVLTDIKYFQGADEYLVSVRAACQLPILRKDFMLDVYQVFEARALGADCILLIMAALEDKQAAELEAVAMRLGMDVLVEVHDEQELQRALLLKTRLVGINNRNLKTLNVDIATTEKLARLVPKDYIVVCESGIVTHQDIIRINASGVYSFLVGESLMLQEDIEEATKLLLQG